MQRAAAGIRVGLAIGVAALVAGCVEPAYVVPGPIQLQQYPPAVSYQSVPDYRPPLAGPIPLQAPPPLVEPLPPPTPSPSVTEVPPDDTSGAIPLQDMPPPVADTAAPGTDTGTAAPAAPPAQVARKAPTIGPGSNVPLEGFRPMHGQSRPTP